MAVAIAMLVMLGQSMPAVAPPPADAAQPRSFPSPPAPRGVEDRWITADDYPIIAQEERMEGTSFFTLSIDIGGRVQACGLLASSGHEQLDSSACRMLVRRARYLPALDRRGSAVAGHVPFTVRWTLPPPPPRRPRSPPEPPKWSLPETPASGAGAVTAPVEPRVPQPPPPPPLPRVPLARPGGTGAALPPDFAHAMTITATEGAPAAANWSTPVEISRTGRVTACQPATRNPALLNDMICARLRAAGRFIPARDSRGRTVAGRIYVMFAGL